MQEKKFVIYFGSKRSILNKITDAFTDSTIVPFIEMQPAFDFLQSSYVEAIVFETFQNGSGEGLNLADLDVLLFYATSESSLNRMIKFYPIDPTTRSEASAEQNMAEILYEDLYEKYLFLMQGQIATELTSEQIALPAGLDLIADLIGTLDDACVELDENLTSTKVAFNTKKEDSTVNSTPLNTGDNDSHLVTGGIEDLGEDGHLVKGNKEDLTEDVLNIKGESISEESKVVVKGYNLEDNEEDQHIEVGAENLNEKSNLINGTREDLTEKSTIVKGHQEDLNEESTLLNGDAEDLAEETNLINGTREDLTEESTLVKGHQDDIDEESTVISGEAEDLKEEITVVKSLQSDEPETKTVIKGSNKQVKKEFMKLKSLTNEDITEDSDETDSTGINQRNELGQTPVMLFSKIGNFEKAEDLINKGADLSLNCKEGKSILHYACQNSNNLNLVKFLVEKKSAKIGKRDSSGKDPLYEATVSDSPEIVRFLLDQGARITSKIDGSTYLHIAAQKNKIQSFKVLLTYGANTDATDDKGLTVSQYCKSKKKLTFLKVIEAVKRLKQKKAS